MAPDRGLAAVSFEPNLPNRGWPGSPCGDTHAARPERCTALEHQFDQAIKAHSKSTSLKSAKAMRSEGGSLCAGGKQSEGTQKLEQALKSLGETPKS